MLYGILLESVRDGICRSYGSRIWKRVIEELEFEHDSFTTLHRYEDNLIEKIAECLVGILDEGSSDGYMRFFGECFVHFFTNYGFDKILRVAGRYFRDFLHSIDQLHDSNKFSFPQMKSPLFFVLEEDEHGVFLQYKSRRRGFQQYVIGQLTECASRFYNEKIEIQIRDDLSTDEFNIIVFRVDFNNSSLRRRSTTFHRISTNLPDIKSETFFQIFPFFVIIDSSMHIYHVGKSIKNLFSPNTNLRGRHFSQVFRLIRPDIPVEFDKFLRYGRHIVFIIESIIALRHNTHDIIKDNELKSISIRLKGQMKWINQWNMIAFLCHPLLSTTDEMINIGLTFHDLNFYDGSSEMIVSGMQHAKTLQKAIKKQHEWVSKLQSTKNELQEWRKKGKQLLYSMMPRHIVQLLQQGIVANSICESHSLITVLFCYILDFKEIIEKLSPNDIIDSINQMISILDRCSNKYNVFKVEAKADSSYMVVSGMQDRAQQRRISNNSHASENTTTTNSSADAFVCELKNPFGLNQAEIAAALALDLITHSKQTKDQTNRLQFKVKIGFHSGSAVGGIVGHKNYQYCLFGDTINTASRVATTSEAGQIHLTEASWNLLRDSAYFEAVPRGKIEMKGKGEVATYWLSQAKQTYIDQLDLLSMKENIIEHDNLADYQTTLYELTEQGRLGSAVMKGFSYDII